MLAFPALSSLRIRPAIVAWPISAFLLTLGLLWWWLPGRPAFVLPDGEAFLGFTPDGRSLVSVAKATAVDREISYDGPIRVRTLTSGRQAGEFAAGEMGLHRPVLSPDGSKIATWEGTTVRIWDVATGHRLAELAAFGPAPHPFEPYVTNSCFSRDGALFAYLIPREKPGDWPPSFAVAVWDIAAARRRATIPDISFFAPFAFSPDSTTLAVSAQASDRPLPPGRPAPPVVRLWDMGRGAERAVLAASSTGHPGLYVRSLSYSPDGSVLAAGTNALVRAANLIEAPAEVKLWDVATGRERATISTGQSDDVVATNFSADGRTLLARFGTGRLGPTTSAIFDISATPPRPVRELSGAALLDPGRGVVASSNDAENVAKAVGRLFGDTGAKAGAPSETVMIYEPGRSADVELCRIGIRDGAVYPRSFSGDGKTLAVGLSYRPDDPRAISPRVQPGAQGVRLFDVTKREEIAWMPGADDARFSPDGGWLVTYGRGAPARIFSLPARPGLAELCCFSSIAALLTFAFVRTWESRRLRKQSRRASRA